MKFFYITAKTYPSTTADHAYIRQLASALNAELGDDFLILVSGDGSDELSGIRHLSLGLKWRKFRSLYYFFWLTNFLVRNRKEMEPGIFFSNDQNLMLILIFLRKAFFLNIKIVSDWHMLSRTFRDRLIAKNSDLCVSTCRRIKQAILAISAIPEKKIVVAYGGVHPEQYGTAEAKAREELQLPQDKKLVGYVGLWRTLGVEKGIAIMIEALLSLPSYVQMVFVGGTENEIKEYSVMADGVGVKARCIFIPKQSLQKVALYEQAMDILTIPYPDQPHFRDFGFPMKIYEYMAANKPVVYSRLGLIEEVMGDNGYGFKADEAGDLSRAILQVFDSPEEAKEKAARAFESVQKYSWKEKAAFILKAISGAGSL